MKELRRRFGATRRDKPFEPDPGHTGGGTGVFAIAPAPALIFEEGESIDDSE